MFQFDPHTKSIVSSFISDESYYAGFGTRLMGNMTDASSVAQYFESIGRSYSSLYVPTQKHSTNIESNIEGNQNGKLIVLENIDGLTSKQSGALLVAWTADCVPIIFADKKNGIVGISHSGWKGTANGMAAKMVQSLVQSGAEKESLMVAIGPSIGACCYDVDEERVAIFKSSFPSFVDRIIQIRGGKNFLNLLYTNVLLLQSEGIPAGNIDWFPFCTKCDEKKFFSYRREGESHGNMISYAMRIK